MGRSTCATGLRSPQHWRCEGANMGESVHISPYCPELIEGFSRPWSRTGSVYSYNGEPPSEWTRYKGNFMTCQTCIPVRGSIPAPYLGRQLVARPHFCTDMLRIRGKGPARAAPYLYRRNFMENLSSITRKQGSSASRERAPVCR